MVVMPCGSGLGRGIKKLWRKRPMKTSIRVAAVIGFASLSILASSAPVFAQDRMPQIAPEKLTEAQKKASEEFMIARKVPVFGPFVPLLRSPEFMLAASNMGLYLRYRTSLPLKINELVILLTAREWNQQVEWEIHYPIALKAGLDAKIADAVAEGRRPENMPEEEQIAYDFSTELHHNKSVSDATYAKALAKFGEQGLTDMAGTNGYYTLLAMSMNVARTAGAPDAKAILPKLIK